MPYSFLLVSWGTSGDLSPLLTAGRQLLRHGHKVRVIAAEYMRSEAQAAGVDFVAWQRAPVGIEADPVNAADQSAWTRKVMFNPAKAYAADVRDEVLRVPTDGVLSFDLLFGAVIGAQSVGIPVAMLSPHICLYPLPGVPPIGSGLLPAKTPQERAEIDAASAEWIDFMDEFLPLLNDALTEFGLPALKRTADFYEQADRLLLAISQTFDFPADSLPANLRYVGPLLDQPNWSGSWQAPWPQIAERPRVLISCSSGCQGQEKLFQQAINGMETLDVDAVATTGPNVDGSKLHAPQNVHLLHSAPHDTVMKEVSVVITQGGHGTVSRALLNGLPQLVIPNGRDQDDNAARVVASGAGLSLPPDASQAEIAAAVLRLINEPEFRDAARLLGERIKADIAASTLVRELENMVAEHQRVHHP